MQIYPFFSRFIYFLFIYSLQAIGYILIPLFFGYIYLFFEKDKNLNISNFISEFPVSIDVLGYLKICVTVAIFFSVILSILLKIKNNFLLNIFSNLFIFIYFSLVPTIIGYSLIIHFKSFQSLPYFLASFFVLCSVALVRAQLKK